MEDSIKAGLNGPADGPASSAAEVLDYLPGPVADWARHRRMPPNSATAIALVLGICAAAWFSGGTGADDAKAAIALGGSYVAGWPQPADPGPAGAGRLALIAAVASIWGSRIALLALLAWGIAATGYALTSRPAAYRVLAVVSRCRDDGQIARWLGLLVRGNLPALPPALAGLAATATLALLGLQNLPGVLVLTPVVAMLLAAPGSAAPPTGPADWRMPALLQAGQFLYLAALGFRCGVPAPLTFTLCAVIALHYALLASPGRPGPGGPPAAGQALGWEGRMLVAGLGALAGLTTFAYAVLTAYLGVLIWSEVMRREASR